MTSRDKVIEFMYSARHKLEADWTQDLEDMNIYDDVMGIYHAPGVEGDTLIGNIILCFTVLAYDNRSRFLEPHKNRWENKQKIMVTLAGLSAMTMPIYVKVIDNGHKEAFELSQWYIKFQKDWRWQEAITLMEYHSMASNMSNKGALDAKEAVDIGRMLQLSEQRRIRADEIVNELRTEFLSLDTALEKEDRSRITDMESIDFMKFETHLGARQKALKQNASSA